MKAKLKVSIALMLAVCMLLTFAGPSFAQPTDIQGHWAESQINKWVNQGLAKGYTDGTFKPNNSITRAEFITLVNRALGYTETAEINFSDVSPTDWYAGEIAKAKAAGYVSGYQDGTIKPNSQISRQEVASMLARILKLEADNPNIVNSFKDAQAIPQWSKGSIAAVVEKGYMGGYPDQTFKATRSITRAEAIVTLDRAVQPSAVQPVEPAEINYDKAGTYGPASGTETIEGDVTISASGVTLQNLVITGDLLLAESIGDGDVTLKNITVKGETIIKGGGKNSVELVDCDLPSITVDKDGVRIVAKGKTSVKIVKLESGATLVELSISGPGFENVTVTQEVPKDAKISLSGDFTNIEVAAAEVKVSLEKGSIKDLTVTKDAEDAEINLAKNTKVEEMTIDAKITIKGKGEIDTANVNADGVKSEIEPKETQGKEISEERRTTGGGGGGGGGDSDSDSKVEVTAIKVTGVANVGETLTAEVTPSGAKVNYQWMSSGSKDGTYTNIKGATNKTYTLTEADAGKWIKVKATGTGNYKGTVESKPVGPVKEFNVISNILEAEFEVTK